MSQEVAIGAAHEATTVTSADVGTVAEVFDAATSEDEGVRLVTARRAAVEKLRAQLAGAEAALAEAEGA